MDFMTGNIYLIGMMGSGKSTVGRLLAQRLCRNFIDIDTLIERESGESITRIFETKGEEYFRKLESETLTKVSRQSGNIIATGGGIVVSAKNVQVMKSTGRVILLDRPLSDIAGDIELSKRPLLKDGVEALIPIYKKRESIYRLAADIIISGSMTAEQAADKIISQIGE